MSGRWFKGNLHTHSFWSDGGGFPEAIARWYRDAGYHFLAFTEHDRLQEGELWVSCDPPDDAGRVIASQHLLEDCASAWGESWLHRRREEGVDQVRLRPLAEYRHHLEAQDRFLLLNGEEVTARWGDGSYEQTHWINVFNTIGPIVGPPVMPNGVEAMRGVISAVSRARCGEGGALVSLNHPNWRWNAVAEEIAAVDQLRFMEIYTALDSCRNAGDDLHASAERIWDVVLTLRRQAGGNVIYGLAADDCHAYLPGHPTLGDRALPGRAWIQVRAEKLSTGSVLSAMHRGDFYASTGVELEAVEISDDRLNIAIRPDGDARFETCFVGTRRGFDARSEPIREDTGQIVRTTRRYSNQVGQVLACMPGLDPVYRIDGDELYVRAVVTSSRRHPNGTTPDEPVRAWTQPFAPGGAPAASTPCSGTGSSGRTSGE